MTGNIMAGISKKSLLGLVLLLSLAATTAPSAAADYPNRPVRWLIGFSAGGPVDIVARIMSQWLSDRFGQQFVVENRTGSGGNIAAAAGISSPPDGYTLIFVAPNNAISASLYKKLPYDFIRDTVPVASIMQLTNMLVVANAMPVKSVQELIAYCKANPDKISYASSASPRQHAGPRCLIFPRSPRRCRDSNRSASTASPRPRARPLKWSRSS